MANRLRDKLIASASYMRGNILILTLTGMLGAFGRAMTFPYASLYILALGGEPAQIGWINSFAALAGLIAFPIAGYLTDHTNRVKLTAVTGVIAGSVFGLYAIAPTWHWIAAAALLMGFSVLQFPPTSALIADSLAPGDRGKGIATMSMLSGLPSFIAPLAAGLLLKVWDTETGMRVLYAFLLVNYLVVAYINLRCLKDPRVSTDRVALRDLPRVLIQAYSELAQLVRDLSPSLRALGAVIALGFVTNALAGPFWIVYAIAHMDLDATQWGVILLVETALLYGLSIPAGVIVDRVGRRASMLGSLALTTLALLAFPYASNFATALLIRGLIAIAGAFFTPACAALMADSIPRQSRGRIMAILGKGAIIIGNASGGTGGPGLGLAMILPIVATSWVAGSIYGVNPRLPWLLGALAVSIAILLTIAWVREPARAEI